MLQAVAALGALARTHALSREAVLVLVRRLADTAPAVREEALRALAQLREETQLGIVADVVLLLGAYPPAHWRSCASSLTSPTEGRQAAVEALAGMRPSAQRAALPALVRAAACGGQAAMGAFDAMPAEARAEQAEALVDMLRSEHDAARGWAAEAFGRLPATVQEMRSPDIAALLTKPAVEAPPDGDGGKGGSGNGAVQAAAVRALSCMDESAQLACVGPLVELLRTSEHQDAVARGLAAMRPVALHVDTSLGLPRAGGPSAQSATCSHAGSRQACRMTTLAVTSSLRTLIV